MEITSKIVAFVPSTKNSMIKDYSRNKGLAVEERVEWQLLEYIKIDGSTNTHKPLNILEVEWDCW